MNYIVVSGGVISGLGKGVTTSSIGVILQDCGFDVTAIKIDPYINVDAGTMSPYEHGECYVLDDGSETDLDLGCYERFLNLSLTGDNSITTGKVYQKLLEKERRGDFLGKTVQIIPHFTNLVKDMIKTASREITLIELGGTIGDIEGLPFVEALRQFGCDNKNTCFIHLSYIPFLETTMEEKTKPTQHSIQHLRSLGITPDILVMRGKTLSDSTKKKLSFFCQIPEENIFLNPDLPSIYQVPHLFLEHVILTPVLNKLGLEIPRLPDMEWWNTIHKTPSKTVKIAIAGKYTGLKDSYISIIRALEHASFHNNVELQLIWVDTDMEKLKEADGILVPGGFGYRGIDEMIVASKYTRDHKIPYLGICLGMQVLCIDIARHLFDMQNANSTEFDKDTPHDVIVLQDDIDKENMGGTMRLGLKDVDINKDSLSYQYYGKETVKERFRHRYTLNSDYIAKFSKYLHISKDIIEVKSHPFCVGVQFHPEFLSRHATPHPIINGFVEKSIQK